MTSSNIQPFDRHSEDIYSTSNQQTTDHKQKQNRPEHSDIDPLAKTLAIAATSGVAGATVGHLLGGRVGATIGAVVGGVAGAIGSDTDGNLAHAVEEVKDAIKHAPDTMKEAPERVNKRVSSAIEGAKGVFQDAPVRTKYLATDVSGSSNSTVKEPVSMQPISTSQNSLVLPAKTHHRLGVTLGRRGKLDAAIEEFQKALELTPDSAAAHYNLGIAFSQQGNLERGIEYIQQAKSLCLEQGKVRRAQAVEQVIYTLKAS